MMSRISSCSSMAASACGDFALGGGDGVNSAVCSGLTLGGRPCGEKGFN